jgi:uncharacterized protein YwgA
VKRAQLIEAYKNNNISKQELGKLRRMELIDLLKSLESDTSLAEMYLHKNRNKLVPKRLAEKIGYGMQAVNISQSFRQLVNDTEAVLREMNVILADTDTFLHKQSISEFKKWLKERLARPNYMWPTNNRNQVYRRVLWAFYLDTDPLEITKPGTLMNDSSIRLMLAQLDVKITKKEVNTLNYSATSALEEMSDTMQSKAISKLTAENKTLKEKLTMAREDIRELEQKLKVYEARDEALGIGNIKGANIH